MAPYSLNCKWILKDSIYTLLKAEIFVAAAKVKTLRLTWVHKLHHNWKV